MVNKSVKSLFVFLFFLFCVDMAFARSDPNWPLKLAPGVPENINAANVSAFSLAGYCDVGAGDVSINFGTIATTTPCDKVLGVYRFQGDVSAEITTNPIYHCVTQSVFIEQCALPVTNGFAPAGMTFIPNPLKKIVPANEATYQARGDCAPAAASISVDIGAEVGVLTGTCAVNNTFIVTGDASAVIDGLNILVAGTIGGISGATALVNKGVGVNIDVAPAINVLNSPSYDFSGTCSEEGQDVLVSVGGVLVSPVLVCVGASWSVTGLDVSGNSDGPVVIIANHSDALGNLAVPASLSVVKDTVVPTVAVTSAPGIYLFNEGSYDLSGTCSENGFEVSVDVGGVAPAVQPICTLGLWSVTGLDVTVLLEGTVAVTVGHIDAVGNTNGGVFNTFKELTPLMFLATSSQTVGSTNFNLGADEFIWTGVLVSSYYFEIDTVNTNLIKIKQPGDYRLSFTLPMTSNVQRSNIIAEVLLNGAVVQGAVSSSSYNRVSSGHTESSDHIDIILNDLSATDQIEVRVRREAAAGAVTGVASLFLEPIVADKTFVSTGASLVVGSNLNTTGGTSVEWVEQKVSSDFAHNDAVNPERVQISNPGNYFVSMNLPYVAGVARIGVAATILLDGTPVPGAVARQGYVRASAGHNRVSLHWQGLLENVTSGQILELDVARDARAGTATIVGGQSASLAIEKIDSLNYISLRGVDVSAGVNWNQTSSVSWTVQNFVDTVNFSHAVGSNEITVLSEGPYFLSYTDSLTAAVVRANVRIEVLLNGNPTGLDCTSHYIRNNNGHNNSSCSISGLLPSVVVNDVISIQTSQEAAAGTVTSNGDARLFILKK